jgi:hypothetical protein
MTISASSVLIVGSGDRPNVGTGNLRTTRNAIVNVRKYVKVINSASSGIIKLSSKDCIRKIFRNDAIMI